MLKFLLCSVLLFAPLLQGIWNFKIQFAVSVLFFLFFSFLLVRSILAHTAAPFVISRENIPPICVLFLAFLSFLLSPVKTLIYHDLINFSIGIAVFYIALNADKGSEKYFKICLRVCAWFAACLGAYQKFALAEEALYSSFLNSNAFALFILMMIPFAVSIKDYPLILLLAFNLVFTGSAAGFLSLAAVLWVFSVNPVRNPPCPKGTAAAPPMAGLISNGVKNSGKGRKWILLLSAILILFAYFSAGFDLKSVYDRIIWWKSAFKMALDRPVAGFGTGSFLYIYPAYHAPVQWGTSSIYVHNYFLEFLSENGFPAFAVWLFFLFSRFRQIEGWRKYSILAALFHSVVDFGLALPGIFWVFCYIIVPEPIPTPRVSNFSPMRILLTRGVVKVMPAVFVIFCLMLAFISFSVKEFRASLALESASKCRHRLWRGSAECGSQTGDVECVLQKIQAVDSAGESPLALNFLGDVYLDMAQSAKDRRLFFESAVCFERLLLLNPYDSSAYFKLKLIYETNGEQELKTALLERRSKIFKW
ncbi:MAG: O-antigen ligase family protein [Elusimicrobia bacterium]|nr:O-antigen ligase family protein [Elusimicrobiota bacterium]